MEKEETKYVIDPIKGRDHNEIKVWRTETKYSRRSKRLQIMTFEVFQRRDSPDHKERL